MVSFVEVVVIAAVVAIVQFLAARIDLPTLRRQPPYRPKPGSKGQLVKLPQGETWYRLEGDAEQPLFVFIHGFSSPASLYENFFALLRERGFRVLLFDLIGRGWSEAPSTVDVRHTPDLYVGQLASLLTHLQINEPFTLCGLSMGGPTAARFTELFPRLVERLVLIAPAGLPVIKPLAAHLANLPVLGDVVMPLMARNSMLEDMPSQFVDPTSEQARKAIAFATNAVVQQIDNKPNYLPSLLSTLRHFPLGNMVETYRNIGKHDRDVLVLWSDNDKTCPFSNWPKLKQLVPKARLHEYSGFGHFVMSAMYPDIVQRISNFAGLE